MPNDIDAVTSALSLANQKLKQELERPTPAEQRIIDNTTRSAQAAEGIHKRVSNLSSDLTAEREARMLADAENRDYTKRQDQFSNIVALIALGIAILSFVYAVLRGGS